MIEHIEREMRDLFSIVEFEIQQINEQTFIVAFTYYDYDVRVFYTCIVSTNEHDVANSTFEHFAIKNEITF